MHRLLTRTAAALTFGAALAGCSSFLESEKAERDPNFPSAATRDQLFVAAQANIFSQQEGPLAMIVCQWMQQCSGINGRFVQVQDSYNVNAGTFDLPFQEVYSAGGLLALRTVQASANAAGDKVYEGIAQVLEALLVGTTADIWGNIPYREAVGDNPTPVFDPQQQVYSDVQALLDQAITNIGGAGQGPGAVDLFFGSAPNPAAQKARWIGVARTLKARYHMHTAERLGNAAYTAARTAALQGIASQPTAPPISARSTAAPRPSATCGRSSRTRRDSALIWWPASVWSTSCWPRTTIACPSTSDRTSGAGTAASM
jgi:starch-binding outer membrane protein, SusD/RagB family